MANVTESVESARGCGFRQEGGKYLITDPGPMQDCGRLPLALDRCPTCDAGIKPSRGWTWINAATLLDGKKCRLPARVCATCMIGVGGALSGAVDLTHVGLLWIGEKFYATPRDWTSEAIARGVSRRLSAIPKGFKLGETLVFVAHRKAINAGRHRLAQEIKTTGPVLVSDGGADVDVESDCPGTGGKACEKAGCVGGWLYTPGVFHVFRPARIEYVVKPDDDEEKLDELEAKGFTLVKVIRDGEDASGAPGAKASSLFEEDEVEVEA